MIKRDEVVKYVTIINRAIAEFPISLIYFIALSEQCQF
jgi:hypothetical protein